MGQKRTNVMEDALIEDRLSLITKNNTTHLLLDNKPLLEKNIYWYYVKNDGNLTTYKPIPSFDENLLKFLLDDIILQLELGIDRNKLTITTPKPKEENIIGEIIIK